jgi:uncharacterized glyoxalase superfamily protein PhnB
VKFIDSYVVVVTDATTACRDFYVTWFGFDVAFDATWFVLLKHSGEVPLSLAFMRPDHPSSPPSPGPHRGDGSILTLQVEDAAAEHQRLVDAGVAPAMPVTDEPWGQRRFGVVDPAGMWIDIVEQISPVDGWWDPYRPNVDAARG